MRKITYSDLSEQYILNLRSSDPRLAIALETRFRRELELFERQWDGFNIIGAWESGPALPNGEKTYFLKARVTSEYRMRLWMSFGASYFDIHRVEVVPTEHDVDDIETPPED